MELSWKLGTHARRTIEILRLPGESNEECADRLLANLLQISYNQGNYADHFGPQKPRKFRSRKTTTTTDNA